MGQARKRKQNLLSSNPFCIFCGGVTAATTVEHCPPRALFAEKKWPEGFEFAACENCNNGTSDPDLLVSMLVRMGPSASEDPNTLGLMHRVDKRYPGLLEEMLPSATEARKLNRRLGVTPPPGETHQNTGIMKVTDEVRKAVAILARKLAKAVFFLHVKHPFPRTGSLALHWYTNATVMEHGGVYPLLEQMKGISSESLKLVRAGKLLNDQFEYKLSMSEGNAIFTLQARFGESFGIVVFGSPGYGVLESRFKELADQYGESRSLILIESGIDI